MSSSFIALEFTLIESTRKYFGPFPAELQIFLETLEAPVLYCLYLMMYYSHRISKFCALQLQCEYLHLFL